MLLLILKRIGRWRRQNSLIGLCLQSWWLIAVSISALVCYQKAQEKKEGILVALNEKKHQLVSARREALAEQEELKLELNSQWDPAYIELALMRELGVVPEGQIKVHFEN